MQYIQSPSRPDRLAAASGQVGFEPPAARRCCSGSSAMRPTWCASARTSRPTSLEYQGQARACPRPVDHHGPELSRVPHRCHLRRTSRPFSARRPSCTRTPRFTSIVRRRFGVHQSCPGLRPPQHAGQAGPGLLDSLRQRVQSLLRPVRARVLEPGESISARTLDPPASACATSPPAISPSRCACSPPKRRRPARATSPACRRCWCAAV